MTKLNSIQALRGIAAFAVFLCHVMAIEEAHSERGAKLTDLFINGAHGVDLFFVISGFIMVWVAGDLRRGAAEAGDFLFSRATRIYPLWWLFAAAMVVFFATMKGTLWDAPRIEAAGLDGALHLVHSFVLWPQPEHPVLGVGWTLVHEMYFYIAFAVLILLLPARMRLYGILAWAGIVTIGALAGLSANFSNNLIELIFYPMTLQFVLGALVGYAIKAGWRKHALIAAVVGGTATLIPFLNLDLIPTQTLMTSLGNEGFTGMNPVWRRTIFYGIPVALLIYGLVALELERGLRTPKFMVHLGDWSYSLYLCHTLTISAIGRVTYTLFEPSLVVTTAYVILVTIGTILVSALTYYYFERPSIRLFRRWRGKPSAGANEKTPAPV
ncbi:MAG: acyltransferase [Henriciella sp.]|nr:acyltransferase [Henriciella sp.]MBO6694554.1 acyltransferase [Henriciella sp.]